MVGWVDDYVEGMTATAIARRDRVRIATVSAALKTAGVFDPHGRGAVTRYGPRPHVWAPSRWRGDLTDGETGYVAGIVDGEGSIGTHQNIRGWRLSVAQLASSGLAEWLVERTGIGSVTVHVGDRPNPMAAWTVTRQAEVADALTALLPYLRVKRTRAVEALCALGFPPAGMGPSVEQEEA